MDFRKLIKDNQPYLTIANSLAIIILMAAGVVIASLAAVGTFESTQPAIIELISADQVDGYVLSVSVRNRGDEETQVAGLRGDVFCQSHYSVDEQTVNLSYSGPTLDSWLHLSSSGDPLPVIPPHSTRALRVEASPPTAGSQPVPSSAEPLEVWLIDVPAVLQLDFANGQSLAVTVPAVLRNLWTQPCPPDSGF